MADDGAARARVGTLIDERYKLVDVMASGSMGTVYKAERVPIGKLVAIKFLHASYNSDSEFQLRFERETKVASKLSHPNCVAMLDFGVWEDEPYLVMELVAGTTVRDRIDDGAIAPMTALAFAKQVAAGLAHAHELGIVHRDIKPANLMITDEIGHGERVRILDFGLARLRGNVGRDATQTNMVVGTPNYMAPEQTVPGGTIDARTDIYALGVVLFEMVTGDKPFAGEDTLQLLGMHRAAPIPRLVERMPEGTVLPPGLQDVIDKAMAKSPADRYQTAIELATAIDDVLTGKTAPPVVIEPTKHRASPAADPIATTMLDVDSGAGASAEAVDKKRAGGSLGKWLVVLVLLVGGGAVALNFVGKKDDTDEASAIPNPTANPKPTPSPGPTPSQSPTPSPTPSPSPSPIAGSGSGSVSGSGSGSGSVSGSVSGSGSVSESASGSAEIEMDPTTAEDLDPEAKNPAAKKPDDEADDAPKSNDEVEQHETHAPPAPHVATNLHDAVLLIQQGQRELALSSLRALAKKSPASAYIPFLLGNLYYDKRWWSVSMDHYKTAIAKNPAYRSNPTLNRNVIKMLASKKTQQQATSMLRSTIGHPAAAYVRAAAAHDDNPVVRAKAKELTRIVR